MRAELKQNLYHGSATWETATLNRDLIKSYTSPSGVTSAYKFELYAKSDMLVSINGSNPILLVEGDELNLDGLIWSVKLLDNTGVFRYIAYL